MKIHVSNLSFAIKSEDLQKQFSPYGKISLITIIMDKMTNRSRGFAFIGMPDRSSAEKAIRELNGIMLDNRPIKVKEARSGDGESSRSSY